MLVATRRSLAALLQLGLVDRIAENNERVVYWALRQPGHRITGRRRRLAA
jgi:hypothetical protein